MADVTGEADATAVNSEEAITSSTGETAANTRVSGYQGVGSELIMAYRNSLMNLDLQVINELEDCFMLVFDTNDSYTDMKGTYL